MNELKKYVIGDLSSSEKKVYFSKQSKDVQILKQNIQQRKYNRLSYETSIVLMGRAPLNVHN